MKTFTFDKFVEIKKKLWWLKDTKDNTTGSAAKKIRERPTKCTVIWMKFS